MPGMEFQESIQYASVVLLLLLGTSMAALGAENKLLTPLEPRCYVEIPFQRGHAGSGVKSSQVKKYRSYSRTYTVVHLS